MATIKQQKVIDKMSENIRSKGELLRVAGYSESTSLTPNRILESKGIQSLANKAEAMGLNDELCIKRLKEAIESKNLILAKQTAMDWLRLINQTDKTNINIQNNILNLQPSEISTEQFKQLCDKVEQVAVEQLGKKIRLVVEEN